MAVFMAAGQGFGPGARVLIDAHNSYGRPHGEQIQPWFNTALFAPNPVGTFGDNAKNILRGPRLFHSDCGVLKTTRITERTSLQFRAEFFNLFNNVNFAAPGNTVTSTDSFGVITSAGSPRIAQLALKALF